MDGGRDPEDVLASRAEDQLAWRDPPEAFADPPEAYRDPAEAFAEPPWLESEYADDSGRYEPDPQELEWMLDLAREREAEALEEGIREQAEERARRYLAQNGEAVWSRVERSLDEARILVDTHPGLSLVACLTGAELLIRFLLLRPMLAGMVFHDQLAEHLIHKPFKRRTWLDRDLLPFACGAWQLDLAGLRVEDGGELAWPALKQLWLVRDAFVHRAEPARSDHARLALAGTQALMDGLLEPLAQRLRLAWPVSDWPTDVERLDPLVSKPRPS